MSTGLNDTETKADVFALSPRQKQLRLLTAVTLTVLIIMITVGIFHPFFHPEIPKSLTPELRKFMKVRLLLIYCYWTACLLAPLFLVVLAYLDMREVKIKSIIAKSEMIQEMAADMRESAKKRKPN